MKAEKTLPSLMDVFKQAWDRTVKLWPLFLVQFGLIIIIYASIIIVLLIIFGPLIAKYASFIMDNMKNLQDADWSQFGSDYVARFSDPVWLSIVVGLIFLLITWWLMLMAVFESGLYSSFWRWIRDEKAFDLKQFFKDGFQYMMPMIWLYCWLSLLGAAIFLVFGVIAGLVVGALALIHFNTIAVILCSVLIGLPLVFLFVVAMVLFSVYALVARAQVSQGSTARESLREAYDLCRKNRWRIMKGTVLILVLYVIAFMAVRMVLGLFSMIPLIGILFTLLDFFVAMVVGIVVGVYIPGLTVTFIDESEA
jgi:hypothetical protein